MGGVRVDEIQAYLAAGASVIALGSELVGREAPRSDAELDRIAAKATRATAAVRNGAISAGATG
jgi:2-keto-3-deoxy-6-phosphogluconate aldolase